MLQKGALTNGVEQGCENLMISLCQSFLGTRSPCVWIEKSVHKKHCHWSVSST